MVWFSVVGEFSEWGWLQGVPGGNPTVPFLSCVLHVIREAQTVWIGIFIKGLSFDM